METTPVVIFVAEQLLAHIEKHNKNAVNFDAELKEMKHRIEMMQSYLADTDNLRSKKTVLRTTLKNLRNLMYEADDILTDCRLEDEYPHWSFISRIVFRREMGKKLRDISSRMKNLEPDLGAHLTKQEVTTEGWSRESIYSSPALNSSEVVGLEDDLRKIRDWMGGDGCPRRIGIVGMGGLGKTTLAKRVYHDEWVASQFEPKIWVSISQCFVEEKVLGCILEQLEGSCLIDNNGQRLTKIHQLLTDKTFLIILDDVWDANVKPVNDLFSQLPEQGWIIVTTRSENVATEMQARVHRPQKLNEDQSWTLFCKRAFPRTGGKCQNHRFEELGKEIVHRCRGLPLAIKTIGALLASKNNQYNKWKEIYENFHQQLTDNSDEYSIMASLQLSYAHLPSKLKQLFLCFSIYPEDTEIESEQLVRWWAGEDMIQSTDSKTATEMGYEYLSNLASGCLIEVEKSRGYDGRIYSCKMHDMVRALTIRMAQDEGFCVFDDKGRQKLEHSDDSRWLGLSNHVDTKSVKKLEHPDDPKLRAMLMVTSSPSHFDMSVTELLLKSLRVLDLSDSNINLTDAKAFWNWITSLKRLAYLNLSNLTGLRKLPRSIEKLRNLQLLILRGCTSLSEINPSIIRLKKLRVLDVGQCRVEYLPSGLGKLSNLEELTGLTIAGMDSKNHCWFSELKELAQLRVLRINICDESSITEDELKTLSQLDKLEVFAVNAEKCSNSSSEREAQKFGDEHILKMMDRLSPPPNLKELYLKNYRLFSLWSWINPTQLPHVHYVCIEDGNLKELHGSGWEIEGLRLTLLQRLDVKWKQLEEDMPLLRYVEARGCNKLDGFPDNATKVGGWYKNQVASEETS